MRTTTLTASLALVGGFAHAATIEYTIPVSPIGLDTVFAAFLLDDAEFFDGGTVIDARLDLSIFVDDVDPDAPFTNDAANFFMDSGAPIDISSEPGIQGANLTFTGADAGWSGRGSFTYSGEITAFIGGTFRADSFYSSITYFGVTPEDIVIGAVDEENSFITITVEQIPAPGTAGLLALGGLAATRRRR